MSHASRLRALALPCFALAQAWAAPLFTANFTGNADGFAYADDAFRYTAQPSYASGTWVSTGGASGGALKVNIGGVNDNDINDMSGGWTRSFTLSQAGGVRISFLVKIEADVSYEDNEYSEAMVSLDGNPLWKDDLDYVIRVVSGGNSGWHSYLVEVPDLLSGSHTITIGGYNNRKTETAEATAIYFDEVVVDDNLAPTVTVSEDGHGMPRVAPADVVVRADASDPENDIDSVRFFLNSVHVGTDVAYPYQQLLADLAQGSNSLSAIVYDGEGLTGSHEVYVEVGAAPVGDVYLQKPDADGVISIEAEKYSSKLAQGGHDWTLVTSPAGHYGPGAMKATPDNGANVNGASIAAGSPRMDYRVVFADTGVYYLWTRGSGPNGSGDSYHAGLDGQVITTADTIGNFPAAWTWRNASAGGALATFRVETVGEHVLNVWMREDGVVLDKLVITKSAGYDAGAANPAPSAIRGSDIDVTFIDVLPHYDYDAVKVKPANGDVVTFAGHVKNHGPARTAGYKWFLDGQILESGNVALPANAGHVMTRNHTWDGNRHEIMLHLDHADALAETSEENNIVFEFTDAISAGLQVEKGYAEGFQALQAHLGIGSASFENWGKNFTRVWNLILMDKARSFNDDVPLEIEERVRFVPGYQPDGGVGPGNGFTLWKHVDMLWGFTTGEPGHFKSPTTWFHDGALMHEMSHARYLIDNYSFDLDTNAVDIMDGGQKVWKTDYMPWFSWGFTYNTQHWGVMEGQYHSIYDLYGGYMLNRIKGQRCALGNTNYANREDFTNTDLPDSVGLILRDLEHVNWSNARVDVYRATGGYNIGGIDYDDTIDATFHTDANGRVRWPKSYFQVPWGGATWNHHHNLILKITSPDGTKREYRNIEAADYQIGFWRGATQSYDKLIMTNFDPVPYVDAVEITGGELQPDSWTTVKWLGRNFKEGFTIRFHCNNVETQNAVLLPSSGPGKPDTIRMEIKVGHDEISASLSYRIHGADGKDYRIKDPYKVGLAVNLSAKPHARFTHYHTGTARQVYFNGLWSHDWGRFFEGMDLSVSVPTGVGRIASYSWNFGDSGTSSAAFPTHTYASSGNYTVTLTVTDLSGQTGAYSKEITVP